MKGGPLLDWPESTISGLSPEGRRFDPAVNAPTANAELRLERALQLLAHSGHAAPAGDPGSPEWLQGLVDALVDRRSFDLALGREIDRVARSGEPALLLALDIDHFKRINDTFGHAAGDLVLRAVAGALTECVRPMDLVARVGGEEFAIILPNCPSVFGETVAERVRRRIERMPIVVGAGHTITATVSIGGAFAPQWVRSTPGLWIERADQQLYRAKALGRNLVQLEPAAVSVVSNDEKRALFDSTGFQDFE
jgi:diguanylate cyclase (GGDEF)-like protein